MKCVKEVLMQRCGIVRTIWVVGKYKCFQKLQKLNLKLLVIIENIFNIKNIKTIFEIIVKYSLKLIEQNLKQIIRIFN